MAEYGPIDYSSQLQQLDVNSLLAALQIRNQNRDRKADNQRQDQIVQLSRDKFTAEQHQNEQWRTDLAAYSANPTPDAYQALWMKYPEHYDALKKGHDEMTSAQQRDVISVGARALAALANGSPDLAVKALTERRDALKSANINTDETDAALALARSPDPAKQKQGMALLTIALTPGAGVEGVTSMMKMFGLDEQSKRDAAKDARDERRLDQGDKRIDIEGRRADAAISQGAERIGLSRAAGARAAAKANGSAGGAPTAAPALSTATVGGKHYTKRGGKWYQE